MQSVVLFLFMSWTVALLLFMSVESGTVVAYVCGQWHCCCLSLWRVTLLLFMYVDSGIVAVYVYGEWHCCCLSVGSDIVAVYVCG
jgi:hypothetical protein